MSFRNRRSYCRLSNLSLFPEKRLLGVDYWVSKILVEQDGWFLLERSYDGNGYAAGVFPGTGIGTVIEDLFTKLIADYADKKAEDKKKLNQGVDALEDYEQEIPDNFSRAYTFIRNYLGKGGEGIPSEILNFYESVSEEVRKFGLFPENIRQNIEVLRNCLCLTDIEAMVLFVLILIQMDASLRKAFNCFDFSAKGFHLLAEVIAWLIDVPSEEVQKIISPNEKLVTAGILTLVDSARVDAEDLFRVFDNENLLNYVWGRLSKEKLFSNFLLQPGESTLELKDFSYLPALQTTLLPFLRQNSPKPKKGINILLYGPPGTGKTELSRLLAKECGLKLYEPNLLSERNNSDTSSGRWKTWRLASALLSTSSDVVLAIDEADDLFNGNSDKSSGLRTNKGFINKCLEENLCPTIWMTNSISQIDASMIRRFTFVLEVGNPPLTQLKEFAQKKLGNFLDDKNLSRLTQSRYLSPGLISQASEILSSLNESLVNYPPEIVMSIIEEKLKAQGFGELPRSVNDDSYLYDPALTNSTLNLFELAKGVKEAGAARICIYGPPGTGKTAYAKWLASYLGKPLITKKASDLLDCYLGKTEQAIAGAFNEARKNNSVLLMDEIDSFLRDRTLSSYSWEVTQVNELLTQLESFEGIFIATTNLLDLVDSAALRRFDLKTKFDFLKSEQSKELFKKHCSALQLKGALGPCLIELENLENLTPGDFAAVNRQFKFRQEKSTESFLETLKEESKLKGFGSGCRKIGFA